MQIIGVILARTGSKSLPEKCLHPVLGRAMIEYAFDHALGAETLNAVVLTTDSPGAKALATARGLMVVDRPAKLADDTATVDAAARHAVLVYEEQNNVGVDVVVLLYANIPVRAEGVIDQAVRRLLSSGADSVRTVAAVSKQHPDWLHRLEGDRMFQYRRNNIYRRQDLDSLYYHDGAVVVTTRRMLFRLPVDPDDRFAFLGDDRRAIIQGPNDAVDVDEPHDVLIAEAILQSRQSEHAH